MTRRRLPGARSGRRSTERRVPPRTAIAWSHPCASQSAGFGVLQMGTQMIYDYDELAALTRAARDGDGRACGRIVELTRNSVEAAARVIVHNPEEAEDIAQETYLRTFLWSARQPAGRGVAAGVALAHRQEPGAEPQARQPLVFCPRHQPMAAGRGARIPVHTRRRSNRLRGHDRVVVPGTGCQDTVVAYEMEPG